MKRLLLLAVIACATISFAGDKEKYSDVKVTVIKDENGKPIRNAAVVLHALSSKGKQEGGGLNLKTDNEGHAHYDSIPFGKLRVQVIMSGFQTWGEDVDINQPEQEVVVKMKPPQKQYSIYDHPGAKPLTIDPDKK